MNVLGLTSLIITFILLLVPIKITAQNQDKTFCVLHNFGAPNSKDAIWNLWPGAMAVTDDGSIWTAVNRGGSFDLGAVIKITPEGNYLKVADLDAATGGHPQGGLVNGNNGYLYGTTSEGGRWGAGTIFRVSAHGGSPEVIYDFRNGRSTLIKPEGECTTPQNCKYSPDQIANMSAANPISSPVVVNGNLYGVTPYSNHQQYGTLYTISLATTPRPNPIDGKTPEDGDKQFKVQCIFQPSLAKDPDMKRFRCNTNGTNAGLLIAGQNGKLYGTTYWTETARHGTVFEATTGGVVTSIHEFNSTDGSGPIALMYGSDGKLYGTTVNGGRANAGVVFKIERVGLQFDFISAFPKPNHKQ